ncbi:MAG TPA: hypothetical protein VJC05_01250, partial [Candidatus Andersenbacteria bacterium]|nr:hypothetical protein [Candidatus Andersenbacteria bacterium]
MGALLLVLVPVALAGYWWSAGELGIADWDYYFSLHHVYRHSLAQLHTFPFWNPYTCGGTAGLADPEFPVFTPTFLLELLFGIPAGLRLAIYLSVMIGAGGMLLLAKRLGVSPLAGGFSALVVSLSTVTLLEITEGHVNVFAAMWIPWIFWSWLGAYRGGSALVPGIFLALTFYQGGVYLLMYTGLVFIALIFVVPRPRVALAVTIKAGLWALGLSALKLLPVLAWLRQFPDEAYTGSAYTLPYLPQILFGRYLHGAYVIPGQVSGWHEYGAYVGYGVLALALIGLSLFFRRRHVRILLVGLVATLLLSASGPYLAPVFDQLWFFPRSNISRLILLSIIALALLAALGLDHLRRRSRHRLLPVLAAGLVAIDILSLSAQVAEQAFVLPPVYPKPAPAPGPIAFITETFDPAGVGSRTTRAYEATRAGYGTFAYCSVLGPGAGRVRTIHDEGGSRLVAGEAHEVSYEVLEWSPNGALVRITLLQEDTITLNTNYASGWRVNGTPARNVGGLVGVVLPVGEHDVLFSYRAPGWRTGLVVTSLTLLAMIWRIKKRLPFFKKMFTY